MEVDNVIYKIIGSLTVNNAALIYKFFKIGFKFHNGVGTLFIEI